LSSLKPLKKEGGPTLAGGAPASQPRRGTAGEELHGDSGGTTDDFHVEKETVETRENWKTTKITEHHQGFLPRLDGLAPKTSNVLDPDMPHY